MMLAIFDVDGTLVRGSSERLFFRFLLRRGRLRLSQLLAYLAFVARYLPTGGIHTLKKNKAYLAGSAGDEIASLAARFVDERLATRLHEPVVLRLKQHLCRGDTVMLLSGTLDPIARALAARLGVTHVCATLCAERRGQYLAQPPEVHPFGAAKVSLARQRASQLGFDLSEAVAYGDSAHDVLLLEAVGHPVAVFPDRTLFERALERNWEIMGTAGDQPAVG